MNDECLSQCLVYKATSTTSSNSSVYYGPSEGELKSRYNNHTKAFRHRECMNETELSKPMSILKDHGLDNNLSLEIHKKASPYQCGSKRCDLCLIVLNKRTELISKCRHRNNFFWPKLRNNCHGVVFNCLLHILCKNTEQN